MSLSTLATVAATPAATFHLRHNLADTGSGAHAAPYCQSPDIIQSDTPLPDPPAVLRGDESWRQAYRTAPIDGINHYYVRGRNGSPTVTTPQASLFAFPAQLIPWPSLWGTPMPTADGQTHSALGRIEPGQVGVSLSPFRWSPAALPDEGDFHALVAWSTHTAHPVPPPVVDRFADMAALLTSMPALAINQLACLDADAGPWRLRVGLTVPENITDVQPVTLLLSGCGLQGASVGVIADTYTAGRQLLQLPPQVPPDGSVVGFSAQLEPGYRGHLTVQIWPGAIPPVHGATLMLQALYPVPQGQLAKAAQHGTLSPAGRHLRALGITPAPMSPLGEVTISFSRG